MARSMASLQGFPSFPPCAPLEFLSRPKSSITIHEKKGLLDFSFSPFTVFFSFLNKYRDGLRTILAPLQFTQYINRPPNSRSFLKISKEIGKAWHKSLTRAKCASLTRPQGVFSALFQTFCLTARTYLNMQKYGLFCSLLLKLHRNHKGASLNSLKISEMSLTILLFLTISSSLHVLCRRADLVKKKTLFQVYPYIVCMCFIKGIVE